MHDLYRISLSIAGPAIPQYWSYSQLTTWRACPLQWYLTHSKYSHTPEGGYPPFLSPYSVQGRIVHKVTEKYLRYIKVGHPSSSAFPFRSAVRSAFSQILDTAKNNPRVNVSLLKTRFSINQCINQVKRIARTNSATVRPITSRKKTTHTPPTPLRPSGLEVQIEVDRPPLCGRVDLLTQGKIIDYKTGSPSETHQTQLCFYALLYWLKTQQVPSTLAIFYTQTATHQDVDIPTATELESMRDELCEEIETIHQSIKEGQCAAKVEVEQCRYCSVRQLCGAYWQSSETRTLRLPNQPDPLEEVQTQNQPVDIFIESLPPSWQPGTACTGLAYSPDLGEVRVHIDQNRCPQSHQPRPSHARILGGLIKKQQGIWVISMSAFTEVFWISN